MKKLALLLCCCALAQGAANIVVNGLTVDTQGRYVATFSPCVSPLSFSTGTLLTGGNPSDHAGNALTVYVNSISGCTLTMTAYQNGTNSLPVFADSAVPVFFSITTASNLRDASGNTASASPTNTFFPSTANSSTWLLAGGTTGSTHIALQGAPVIGTSQPGSAQWMSPDGCLTFNGVSGGSGGFNVYAFNGTTGFYTYRDGVSLGLTTTTSDNGDSSYSVGGSETGTHYYEVCESLQGTLGPYVLYGLQLTGGMTFGTKPSLLPVMVAFGASEVACQQNNDTTGCAWWIIARYLGISDQHFGQAGWPVTINSGCTVGNCGSTNATALVSTHTYVILTTGTTDFTLVGAASNAPGTTFTATGAGTGSGTVGTTFPADNLRDCAKNPGGICTSSWANYNLSVVPSFGIMIPGGNDAAVGTAIGTTTTPGTFSGDAVTLWSNAVANLGLTKLYIGDEYYNAFNGGTPCPSGAEQLPYENAWLSAASYFAVHNPGVTVVQMPTFATSCSIPPTDFQSGNAHLNPAGQLLWANMMLPYLINFQYTFPPIF